MLEVGFLFVVSDSKAVFVVVGAVVFVVDVLFDVVRWNANCCLSCCLSSDEILGITAPPLERERESVCNCAFG